MSVKKPSAKPIKAKKTVSAAKVAKAPPKAAAPKVAAKTAANKETTAVREKTPVRAKVASTRPAADDHSIELPPAAAAQVALRERHVESTIDATRGEEPDYETSAALLSGPRNVQPYQIRKGEEYMSKEQLEHFRTILS